MVFVKVMKIVSHVLLTASVALRVVLPVATIFAKMVKLVLLVLQTAMEV
jgi:hypothetical protein